MTRHEITIPHRIGARIFVDVCGGVSVAQDHGPGADATLGFEPEEARAVAAAMIEVANAATRQRKGQCKSQI